MHETNSVTDKSCLDLLFDWGKLRRTVGDISWPSTAPYFINIAVYEHLYVYLVPPNSATTKFAFSSCYLVVSRETLGGGLAATSFSLAVEIFAACRRCWLRWNEANAVAQRRTSNYSYTGSNTWGSLQGKGGCEKRPGSSQQLSSGRG